MTVNLEELTETLATDGYEMSVTRTSDDAVVTVSAAAGICGDCLVPKEIMKAFLSSALGLPETRIELVYPTEETRRSS
ncbi:hypothetical protein F6B41_12395 [Microbacterium lushaniae]|nr:hypothetical protein F6B41_12395 [Microbacterium lushaniae]